MQDRAVPPGDRFDPGKLSRLRSSQLSNGAEDTDVNLIVANPSTPAQIYHLLRRQMKRNYRKPLVLASAKGLLRAPVSSTKSVDGTLISAGGGFATFRHGAWDTLPTGPRFRAQQRFRKHRDLVLGEALLFLARTPCQLRTRWHVQDRPFQD